MLTEFKSWLKNVDRWWLVAVPRSGGWSLGAGEASLLIWGRAQRCFHCTMEERRSSRFREHKLVVCLQSHVSLRALTRFLGLGS
nr:hypothetical protein CFP56_52460 [Quercus suber]